MSFITPILITPSENWACAAPASSVAARNARYRNGFIFVLLTLGRRAACIISHTEVLVELFDVGVQLRIGEALDDAAVLHNVIPVGHRRGEAEVLLDQQDGEPL